MKPSVLLRLLSLPGLVLPVQAQIQLLNVTKTPDISDTCVAVLNQQVTCRASLASIGDAAGGKPPFGIPLFLTDAQLGALCISSCSNSLATWQRRIAGACGNTLWNQTNGGKYAMASLAQIYIENYNSACLKNRDGDVCNAVLGELMHINYDNQEATANPVSDFYCDDCFLSVFSTQLAMPMASNNVLKSGFSDLTSACSSTGWTLSNPPTATTFTLPPTAVPKPSCTAASHTISSGETCVDISMSESISTDDLVISNNLPAFCRSFPGQGTELCIPEERTCKTYIVKEGDTCGSLQGQFGIRYAQIVSWNPSLGPKCSNLNSYVGYVICVSNPGGDWVNPSPVPTTSTSAPPPLWTQSLSPVGSYPLATYNASTSDAPYANHTRMDCATYLTAPILLDYTGNGTTSLACEDVIEAYGIDMEEFLDWNPSLNGDGSCAMVENTQYCVQRLATTADDITDACIRMDTVPAGYSCEAYTALRGIDQDQFALWNPSVGKGCEGLTVGTRYCVAVRHFRQPGTTSNCNKFAVANNTNRDDLPCQIIETKFGLSHARFVAWNPAVLSNCRGLYRGYDYCVSIPNYRPMFTTTAPRSTPTEDLEVGRDMTVTGSDNSKVSTARSGETTIATGSGDF